MNTSSPTLKVTFLTSDTSSSVLWALFASNYNKSISRVSTEIDPDAGCISSVIRRTKVLYINWNGDVLSRPCIIQYPLTFRLRASCQSDPPFNKLLAMDIFSVHTKRSALPLLIGAYYITVLQWMFLSFTMETIFCDVRHIALSEKKRFGDPKFKIINC